jgi:hypothetical protein
MSISGQSCFLHYKNTGMNRENMGKAIDMMLFFLMIKTVFFFYDE